LSASEPSEFRVLWGDLFKGLDQAVVRAYDVEEALVIAHELRPDLPPPRTAYLVAGAEVSAK
jgi:hypothetical protein